MAAGEEAFALRFRSRHLYPERELGITVPVQLRTSTDSVSLDAKIDTGAQNCIFAREYGEALGLLVESGDLRTFQTVRGAFRAFGHEVTINVLDVEFSAVVFFTADYEHPRSVLGRDGWLNRVRLAIIDYDFELYLAHYDE